ncbi:MAG: hypothetical protein ACI3ZN_09660 [Candidatus Cryptobacteroides sp.]
MKLLARVMTALLVGSILLSCNGLERQGTTEFEKEAMPYIDTYELTEVKWSGIPVDLNGDNVADTKLYNEYHNMLGYYPGNHYAEAKMSSGMDVSDGKESMMVTAKLPVPHYIPDGSGYKVGMLTYLEVSFRIEEIQGFLHQAIISRIEDPSDPFISGIREIRISEMSPDEFVIRMHCHLYKLDGSYENLNYMYFTFHSLQ